MAVVGEHTAEAAQHLGVPVERSLRGTEKLGIGDAVAARVWHVR
jgi:hypothetical protein